MDSNLLDQIRHLCRDRAAYEHLKAILLQQERVHQLSWEEQYTKLVATSEAQGTEAFSKVIAREKALAQLAEAIQRSPSLDLVLEIAVQVAQKLLQVDRVAIFRLYSDGLGEFITDAIASGLLSLTEMPERQHSLTRHIIEFTQTEESVQISTQTLNSLSNSSLSSHSINLLEQIGIASYAANKIYEGQEVWGTIVAFHGSSYYSWSEVDLTSLSLISAQIAIAIALWNLRQQSQMLAHDLQVLQVEVNDLQQKVNNIAKAEVAKAEVAEAEIAEAEIAKAKINETEDQSKPLIPLSFPIIESEAELIPESISQSISQSIIDTVVQYLVNNEIENDVVNSVINSDDQLSNSELDQDSQVLDKESSQMEEKLEIVDQPPNEDLFHALEQPDQHSDSVTNEDNLISTFLVPDFHTDLLNIEPEDIQSQDIQSEQILDEIDVEDNTAVEEWELDEDSQNFAEDEIDSTDSKLEIHPDIFRHDLEDLVLEPQFIETILMLAGNSEKATEFLINVIDSYLKDAPNLLWNINKAIASQSHPQALQLINSLRTRSAYLGALILSQECRRLESAVKANNVTLIHTCLSLLEIEVQRATDALQIERSRYD